MDMRLSTLDFIRLLPAYLQSDAAVRGLAAGVDLIIPGMAADMATLTTWDRIDQLTESELDELAWELNILWYNRSAGIDAKRDVVKNSDQVYKHLGTKWAVENVITSYFGDGYIKEWYQYDGQPGTFRVYSTNPTLNNDRLAEFLELLEKVKRKSAHLEGIYITLTGEMRLAAGMAVHETGHDLYRIGADRI